MQPCYPCPIIVYKLDHPAFVPTLHCHICLPQVPMYPNTSIAKQNLLRLLQSRQNVWTSVLND